MRESGASYHRPVMAEEVVRILAAADVALLLDATVGAGGHSERFLESRGPDGRVIGLDRDPEMAALARRRLEPFGDRVRILARSFADLDAALDELDTATVDGALFDLGANSLHFDRGERGFSFLSPGPLDMRFDRSSGETAADLVNSARQEELERIFRELGDERRAKRIAKAVVDERPIRDTLRLAEVVERAVGGRGRVHPATRVFQSLRMAVNRELEHVERGVTAAVRRLRPGGRAVVISFHSGEDRLVKRLLREAKERGEAEAIEGPARPSAEEVRANPRARSAVLRACERKGA